MRSFWMLVACAALAGCSSPKTDSENVRANRETNKKTNKETPPKTATKSSSQSSRAKSLPKSSGAAKSTPKKKGSKPGRATTESTFNALLEKFVNQPTKDGYLGLHKVVVSSASYNPYSVVLGDIKKLVDLEDFEKALAKLKESRKVLRLSPRAHIFFAKVHSKLGDDKLADKHNKIATACIKGILATGKGSEDQPYLVVRTSDEYDVLVFLKKRMKSQGLHRKGKRSFDVLHCQGGSVYWFDITASFASLGRRLSR